MSNDLPPPPHDPIALKREKARLRLAGVVILAIGLIAAALLYWLRASNADLDQYREAQARAETHQMELLYGTSGGLTEDLTNALKRPADQAIIIAVVSALIAAGCFYLGRPFPENEDPP